MKQRWLIKALPEKESTPTLELDSQTHAELVTLMASAIESVHVQEANLLQESKEAFTDEQTATASQD